MEFIMPGLAALSMLEKKVGAGTLCLLDTNMFIPPFFDSAGRFVRKKQIVNYAATCCRDNEALNDFKRESMEYFKKYYARLVALLGEHENIGTIERVIQECENSKDYFLNSSRNSKAEQRNRRSHKSQNISRMVANLERLAFNGICRASAVLTDERLHKEEIFSGRREYSEILYAAKRAGEEATTHSNELYADEHLLASAICLSVMRSAPIYVFTYDKDLLHLADFCRQYLSPCVLEKPFPPTILLYRIFLKNRQIMAKAMHMQSARITSSTELYDRYTKQ